MTSHLRKFNFYILYSQFVICEQLSINQSYIISVFIIYYYKIKGMSELKISSILEKPLSQQSWPQL